MQSPHELAQNGGGQRLLGYLPLTPIQRGIYSLVVYPQAVGPIHTDPRARYAALQALFMGWGFAELLL